MAKKDDEEVPGDAPEQPGEEALGGDVVELHLSGDDGPPRPGPGLIPA